MNTRLSRFINYSKTFGVNVEKYLFLEMETLDLFLTNNIFLSLKNIKIIY